MINHDLSGLDFTLLAKEDMVSQNKSEQLSSLQNALEQNQPTTPQEEQ